MYSHVEQQKYCRLNVSLEEGVVYNQMTNVYLKSSKVGRKLTHKTHCQGLLDSLYLFQCNFNVL